MQVGAGRRRRNIMTRYDLPWSDAPSSEVHGAHDLQDRRGRLAAAALLRAVGAALDRLAVRLLEVRPATPSEELRLEYHAEAGAPEGALYVNGQLVGHLTGVSRL